MKIAVEAIYLNKWWLQRLVLVSYICHVLCIRHLKVYKMNTFIITYDYIVENHRLSDEENRALSKPLFQV